MYMELKPPETLREGELAQVAAPWYAITQLKNAWLGHGAHIRGYDKALEACTDPQRQHWDYQRHGFERLCEQVNDGDLVLVLDKSWPPLAPAYAQVNGQWQLTQHISEPRLRQRLESQVQTVQRQQREQETLQSRNQPSSAEVQTVPASGPGNRPASLGPHAGLHNQNWNAVNVKPDSFKTVRKVDMENLSGEDEAAKGALLDQGWKEDKIEQVLKSGDNFTTKELQPGDKLHGFGTAGRPKNVKNSAYWMDEAEFKNVESKYFKNGQWDKEGVKNHLALPCANRATDITTVQVTQPTTGLTSTVAKARETLQYTDNSGYTTGPLGKIMGGGGQQITVSPAHFTKV